MGGVESGFQFLGFKIDNIDLKLTPGVRDVLYSAPVHAEQVQMQVRIRNLGRIPKDRIYVGGIDARVQIFHSEKQDPKDLLLVIQLGAVGIFKTIEESLSQEIEDKLTRIQIPAILFPYLRAAMTSVLSSAGIAGVILPLINVHELAKDAKIEIIDLPKE